MSTSENNAACTTYNNFATGLWNFQQAPVGETLCMGEIALPSDGQKVDADIFPYHDAESKECGKGWNSETVLGPSAVVAKQLDNIAARPAPSESEPDLCATCLESDIHVCGIVRESGTQDCVHSPDQHTCADDLNGRWCGVCGTQRCPAGQMCCGPAAPYYPAFCFIPSIGQCCIIKGTPQWYPASSSCPDAVTMV